jgi:mannosyl-3-phosphoglycerate phosphatase
MWPGSLAVGLASSRTLRELTVLQRALVLPGPCIAEDGARHAVDARDVTFDTTTSAPTMEVHGRRHLHTWSHALTSDALRERTSDEPAIGRADTRSVTREALLALGFRSFGSVRRALASRTHSVLLDPHVWSADDLSRVRHITAARGLQLRRGGRWFTLTTSGGKGLTLRALRHQFTVDGVPPVVAAIGNEENDESLLAEADCRFVIRNPHRGPHPVLSSLPGAVVLGTEGPGGWMDMLDLLVPHALAALAPRDSGATH